jgi:type IV fimbrial biogenesis protein FimT
MGGTRGFTLIEMMVTVGVAAILLGLGVPAFLTTVQDMRMTASVNDLLVSMQLARSESIKRHLPGTVCHSDNATAAAPGCGGAGWQDGWIVFVDGTDANPDPNGSFDAGEELIHSGAGFKKVMAVAEPGSEPLADYLTFLGTGFPQGDVPGGRNLILCDDRHSNTAGRILNVSQTGRPQVRRVTDVAGLAITCEK